MTREQKWATWTFIVAAFTIAYFVIYRLYKWTPFAALFGLVFFVIVAVYYANRLLESELVGPLHFASKEAKRVFELLCERGPLSINKISAQLMEPEPLLVEEWIDELDQLGLVEEKDDEWAAGKKIDEFDILWGVTLRRSSD